MSSVANSSNLSLFYSNETSVINKGYIKKLWMYLSLPMLIIGLSGNALALFVMCKKNRGFSASVPYIRALAVTDSLFLLVSIITYWLKFQFGYEIISAPYICELYYFISEVTRMYSSWLLCAINFDRFLVTLHSRKFFVLTYKQKKRIVLGLLLVSIIICAHLLAPCDLIYNIHYEFFYRNIWRWLRLAISGFGPTFFMIGCSILTIIELNEHKQLLQPDNDDLNAEQPGKHRGICTWLRSPTVFIRRVTFPSTLASSSIQPSVFEHSYYSQDAISKSKTQSSFTTKKFLNRNEVPKVFYQTSITKSTFAMLMLLNFTFFTTNTPVLIFYLIAGIYGKTSHFNLIESILLFILYINHIANFYLYCLTNKKFRNAVRHICLR